MRRRGVGLLEEDEQEAALQVFVRNPAFPSSLRVVDSVRPLTEKVPSLPKGVKGLERVAPPENVADGIPACTIWRRGVSFCGSTVAFQFLSTAETGDEESVAVVPCPPFHPGIIQTRQRSETLLEMEGSSVFRVLDKGETEEPPGMQWSGGEKEDEEESVRYKGRGDGRGVP